ncbi:MAG: response regulator [Gemmatimonadota bacterium]|nr:response regulator [Gemmatimonadota bacterium]
MTRTSSDSGPGPSVSVAAEPPGIDRYRELYEGIALPVIMIDPETWRIVAVNEAAIHQYGYDRREFLGLSILNVRPPEGRSDAQKVLDEAPHGFWRISGVRHQRKDGTVFNADVWARDTTVAGRPARICVISDVTERIQLQHELQQAQKMEAVGRLAGGIAHDFNNVLTTIIGCAELLGERLAGDAGAAGEVQEIRRAADRAASLTRQLLAFSRQQVMRVEVTPINDVVLRTESLLARVLGDHVILRTRLDPGAWPVRVDPGQVEQVLMNLAVNAQDAMPGGGTLTLATRNVTFAAPGSVNGVAVPAGEYAELSVADTGIGMDPITCSRVFEPFFTTKPAPEGTGLGLSMAYGIVRQSGGFITVESALGQGTTFRILLPRAGRADTFTTTTSLPVEPQARQTVLVVEDEDAVRRITCRVLERLGFAVLSAADGREALALVAAGKPKLDLLVTDLLMPHLSGRELAGELGASYPNLRVLFVSGYTDEAVGHLGMLDHGVAFLQKPFSIDSLGDAVRKVLDDA